MKRELMTQRVNSLFKKTLSIKVDLLKGVSKKHF